MIQFHETLKQKMEKERPNEMEMAAEKTAGRKKEKKNAFSRQSIFNSQSFSSASLC